MIKCMRFMVIVFLLLVVGIDVSGCSLIQGQYEKKVIEQSLAEKYNEKFQVINIKKDYTLMPFGIGGKYSAEAIPESNPSVKINVEYLSNVDLKVKDNYQNKASSETMTNDDQKNLDQIFGKYGVNYDSKCIVQLDEYPQKINTSDVQEIENAIKIQGKIYYFSYFLVDSENEVEIIKKAFEEHLEYFKNSGVSASYSIAFCNETDIKGVKDYFDEFEYWNKNKNYLFGFYDILNKIDTVQELRDSYVEV